jgi:hypothetical protein
MGRIEKMLCVGAEVDAESFDGDIRYFPDQDVTYRFTNDYAEWWEACMVNALAGTYTPGKTYVVTYDEVPREPEPPNLRRVFVAAEEATDDGD